MKCKHHGNHNEWKYRPKRNGYDCKKCAKEDRRKRKISINFEQVRQLKGIYFASMYKFKAQRSEIIPTVWQFLKTL